MRRTKIAAVATHPIQYQAPIWRALARRGFDLRVYYATRHGLEASRDRQFGETFKWDIPLLDGYEHKFCRSVHAPGLTGPVRDAWPTGLRRAFTQETFDAVLIHGYATASAWAGLTAAWSTGTRVIMRGESHGVHRTTTATRQRVKGLALPQILRRVDGIAPIGRWNRDYWQTYGFPQSRMQTALYSVDNDRFAESARQGQAAAADLRAKWGARTGDTVFLYCAKLIAKKAPDTLLKAFSRLGERSRLVMVGSGPMQSGLQEQFKELGDRVVWSGFVNQTALPSYYAAADVMVLPSLYEPWGLVVNEAMASGLPCIVSDVVASGADLIEGQGTGAVFRHGDVEALTHEMARAMDPEIVNAWKRNVPRVIDRAHIRHFVDAIQNLCALEPRPRRVA